MPTGFFYGDLPPSLQKSYANDPREQIAQQLLSQGTSTAPLRGGVTEGVLRLANALLGARNQRKIGEEYQQKGTEYNQALTAALAGIKPGHYDPQTGQYVNTDATSILNAGQQNPALAPLAQEFQFANLKSALGTDSDVAGARAKSQFADWRDPEYQELKLKEAALAAGRNLLGPAVTLYAETGNPTLLNSVLGGKLTGAAPSAAGTAPSPATPAGVPQDAPLPPPNAGRIPSTQGGGLPIAPLPPMNGPAPQRLQGPGAGLDSGGGLPFMPPKNVRDATGKAQVDAVQGAIKAGEDARAFLAKTPLYDEAISKVKYAGPGANFVMGARQIGHAIAPNLVDGAVPEEMVNELNTSLTLSANFDSEGKRAFAGNFSDADRNFISRAQAGLGGSLEGLAYKYEIAKAIKTRTAEIGSLAQEYSGDPRGFAAASAKLSARPIVDDSLRQRVNLLIGAKEKPQLTGDQPGAQAEGIQVPGLTLPPGHRIIEVVP